MSHPLLMALFSDVSLRPRCRARACMRWGSIARTCRSLRAITRIEERIANQIDASPGSEIEDSPAASRLGELSGYILAAIAIGLPGTGAVVAAGPLAAELGEVGRSCRRQVAGDLKATLMKAGMSETDADAVARADRERPRYPARRARAQRARRRDRGAAATEQHGRVVRTQWDD